MPPQLKGICSWGMLLALGVMIGSLSTFYHQLPRRQLLSGFELPKHAEDMIPGPKLFYDNGVIYRSSPDDSPPLNEAIPDAVHYVWCGESRVFEFMHFLSVLSAIKVFQPSAVVIHHWYPPVAADNYNMWLDELKQNFNNLVFERFTDRSVMPDCGSQLMIMDAVRQVLASTGGIYMNERVVLQRMPPPSPAHTHLLVSFANAAEGRPGVALLMATKSAAGQPFDLFWQNKNESLLCQSSSEMQSSFQRSKDSLCIYLDKYLFPISIMEGNDTLSLSLRTVFYGSPEVRLPQWSLEDAVPNIGHIILLGGRELTFVTYLGILSLVRCALLDQVYVHGETEPVGSYWTKLKTMPQVVMVHHEWPQTVFGSSINDGAYASDIMRFYILYKFGGVVIDWDALFLKPLSNEIRGYSFVASYDWTDWHHPYPNIINCGVAVAKRLSPFLRLVIDSYRTFNEHNVWVYSALMMPYKLYEKYPELVKIEPRLQVMCYDNQCHPTWKPGYQYEQKSFDYRNDTYSVHLTGESFQDLDNEEAMRRGSSIFAQIGKYILDDSCGQVGRMA